MTYAKGTIVSIEKTEGEIKTMLRKYGATATLFMQDNGRAVVSFHMKDRAISFRLPLPAPTDKQFKITAQGYSRTAQKAQEAYEQASRERWRGLLLCIRAKLESVEAGIESFDDAFLAHVTLPDGQTVGDKMRSELPLQLDGHPPRPLLGGPA